MYFFKNLSSVDRFFQRKIFGKPLRDWLSNRRLALLFSCVAFSWVYAPALLLQPLSDENLFVFSNEVIEKGLNPLLFWTRGHSHTKAWPAFYTVIWVIHRFFENPVIFDHLLSLILHFTNGFLLIRICSRLKIRNAWVAGPLLWFHPAHLLTVSQIMLLTKVLSSFAFLIWFTELMDADQGDPRYRRFWKRFIFFSLSIFSSGQSYLLCLVEWRRYLARVGFRRSLVWAGPFLLIAAYGAFLAIVGVEAVERKIFHLREEYGEKAGATEIRAIPPEKTAQTSEAAPKAGGAASSSSVSLPLADRTPSPEAASSSSQNQTEQEIISPPGELPYEVSRGWAWEYFAGILGLDSAFENTPWLRRIRNVGVTGLYYTQMFFFPFRFLEFVEIEKFGIFSQTLLFLLGLSILAGSVVAFYRGSYLWEALLLSYLPVSGILYIPFTKHFDLVSARYCYLPYLLADILILRWFSTRSRWANGLLFLWVAGLSILTILESRTPGVYQLVNPN